MMICINVAEFVLISYLEKDHSMIEMCRLKNVIFIQRILSFVLSRKIQRSFSLFLTPKPCAAPFKESHNVVAGLQELDI